MRTIHENESTPKADGFYMPGEFEEQERIWILWPHRTDTWSYGAKPAQRVFETIIRTIATFEPITVGVNDVDYCDVAARFDGVENVTVVELSADDSWIRDCGPSFVVNDTGDVRLVDWHFNAWGGLVNGLYFPWDKDAKVGLKVAQLEGVDRYRPDEFVLEGGSFHVDGDGTVMTTEMCLLDPGRNPQYNKEQIEQYLKDYLGCDKVIWLKYGIDPHETNGHIDDVACFVKPGEVICSYTDDESSEFYEWLKDSYETLCNKTDARGRKLKVHKLCMPTKPEYMPQEACDTIDIDENALPRTPEDACVSAYMNFLLVNGGVIVPQFGDPNDALAIEQLKEIFPDRKVVGLDTKEIIYGGGNVHCITQQQPKPRTR